MTIGARARVWCSRAMDLQGGVDRQYTYRSEKIGENLLLRVILPVSALVAMVSLGMTSSFKTMLGIYLRGVVVGVVVGVPDWPYFFRNPLFWFVPLPYDVDQPCEIKRREDLKKRVHSARRR